MTDICYCDRGEHEARPNGSNGVLHIPCSPSSSASSLTATQEESSSRPTIIPKNFVWRLQGGRRDSSSTTSTEPDQEDAMTAADVVVDGPINGVLRDSFDPWNRHNPRHNKGGGKGSVNGHNNDDEVCPGCIKISRAREARRLRDRKRAKSHESSSTLPTAARPNSANPTKQQNPTVTTVTVTMPGTLQHSDLDDGGPEAAPDQLQELKHDGSVLSIAVSGDYIFTGTSKGQIVVWSLSTYQLVQTIQAHKRSVLCLFLSQDGKYLFSTACEPIINVWCPQTFTRLYEIYSTYDVGDVFSVVYSPQHETVYFGTQTQYIQWVGLKDEERKVSHDSANHPDRRQHKFFDSRAVGGTSTPRRTEDYYSLIPRAETVLEVDPYAIEKYAHYGWIFCMQIAKGPTVLVDDDEEILVSGGGDGTIKLWRLSDKGPGYHEDEDTKGSIHELMVLGEDDSESVMSLFVDGSFLYAGKLRGVIELWDLDTKQRLRVIHAHTGNINVVGLRFGLLWSASTDGFASKHSAAHTTDESTGTSRDVSQRYQCLSRWKAHDAKILSAAVATYQHNQLFITGANDNTVRIWHVNGAPAETEEAEVEQEDMMIRSLRQFVSYKTVSSRPEFTEDCRKGATFLGSLFKRLGAQVEMLSSDGPHNPVVFAKFSGKLEPAEKRKRVLFYGHYDVVPADMAGENWKTDPFKLVGQNGYLYGRGVSDNKGPIIAALYAVSDLLQAKALDSDIIFLIEGEEESGSRGFEETIRKHKDQIGHIDYVLLANSYWLDDEVPCLTYGLRGVLHATVCVDSKHPDLHSGVDGSNMISEPLTDLTLLLGKLKGPKNKVNIPGFYDGILPITEEEELRYDDIASILIKRNPTAGPVDALKRSLMARWREPNLTIHRYNVSGPDGSLISSHATANVSIRLVPGQEVEEIISKLKSFLRDEYEQFDSENTLTVRIDNKAEPWLGVPGNYIFRTLEEAVMRAWAPSTSPSSPSPSSPSILSASESDSPSSSPPSDDGKANDNGVTLPPNATNGETTSTGQAAPKTRKPLYIREGGSIPPIRFLEKEFNAPAAHLPCGQASDSAHLHNERLRLVNLQKSREIFTTVFRKL